MEIYPKTEQTLPQCKVTSDENINSTGCNVQEICLFLWVSLIFGCSGELALESCKTNLLNCCVNIVGCFSTLLGRIKEMPEESIRYSFEANKM